MCDYFCIYIVVGQLSKVGKKKSGLDSNTLFLALFVIVATFIFFSYNSSGITSNLIIDTDTSIQNNLLVGTLFIDLSDSDYLPYASVLKLDSDNKSFEIPLNLLKNNFYVVTHQYSYDGIKLNESGLAFSPLNYSENYPMITASLIFTYTDNFSNFSSFLPIELSKDNPFYFDVNSVCFTLFNDSLVYADKSISNSSCLSNISTDIISNFDVFITSNGDLLEISTNYSVTQSTVIIDSFIVNLSELKLNVTDVNSLKTSLIYGDFTFYQTTFLINDSVQDELYNSTMLVDGTITSTNNTININSTSTTNDIIDIVDNSILTLNSTTMLNESVNSDDGLTDILNEPTLIQKPVLSGDFSILSVPTISNLDSNDPDDKAKYNELLTFSVDAYHQNMSHVSLCYSNCFNMTPNPSNTTWTISKTLVDFGCPTNGSCMLTAIANEVLGEFATTTYNMSIDNAKILSCTLRGSSCLANETMVLRLSNYTNAHAEFPNMTSSDYNRAICCQDSNYHIGLNVSFDTGEDILVKLSNYTNAHAETKIQNNYSKSIYFSAAQADLVLIDIVTGLSCQDAGYQACIVSLSDQTNAHLASCDAGSYPVKICGALNNNAPRTKLVTPSHSSYINTNFNFVYNVTDVDGLVDIVDCKLYLNNSGSGFTIYDSRSVSTNINNVPYLVGVQSDDLHWYVKCTDITGAYSIAGINDVVVDTIKPIVSNFYSSDLDNISRSDASLVYYVDAVDEYIHNVKINGVKMNNISSTYRYSSTPASLGWAVGNCTFVVNATDKANNSNSITYTLKIDDSKPNILYDSSTYLDNSFINTDSFSVNVIASDANFKKISYFLYGSGFLVQANPEYTILDQSHFFSNLDDGVYYFKASIEDYANNINNTQLRKITIDTTNPAIYSFNSSDIDNYTKSNINLNFNSKINDTNINYVEIYNGNYKFNMSNSGGLIWSINKKLSDFNCYNGNCILTVKAFDKANNFATSTYTIRVDDNPPLIYSLSPVNSSSLSLPTGSINYISNHSFKVASSTSVVNCSFYHDASSNSINVINSTIFNPSLDNLYIFSINMSVPRSYTWSITCYDDQGNYSSTGRNNYHLLVATASSSSGGSSSSSTTTTSSSSSASFVKPVELSTQTCTPSISYSTWSNCDAQIQSRIKTISGCDLDSSTTETRTCDVVNNQVDAVINSLESSFDNSDLTKVNELSAQLIFIGDSSLTDFTLLNNDADLVDLGYSKEQITLIRSKINSYRTKLEIINNLSVELINDPSKQSVYDQKLTELKQDAIEISKLMPRVVASDDVCTLVESTSSFEINKCSKQYNFESYDLQKSSFKSKYSLSVYAKDELYNVTLIENIPKDIASHVDDITFSLNPIIIQEDPIVKFVVPLIQDESTFLITYFVNAKVDSALSATTNVESFESKSTLLLKQPVKIAAASFLLILFLLLTLVIIGALLDTFVDFVSLYSSKASSSILRVIALPIMLPYVLVKVVLQMFIYLVSKVVSLFAHIFGYSAYFADRLVVYFDENSLFLSATSILNSIGLFIFSIFELVSINVLYYFVVLLFKVDMLFHKIYQFSQYVYFNLFGRHNNLTSIEKYNLHINKVQAIINNKHKNHTKANILRQIYDHYMFGLRDHVVNYKQKRNIRLLDDLILSNHELPKKELLHICTIKGYSSKLAISRINLIFDDLKSKNKRKLRIKLLWFYQRYLNFLDKLLLELNVMYRAI